MAILRPTRRNRDQFMRTMGSELYSTQCRPWILWPIDADQATGILMHRRTELAAKPGASGDSLARIDAMLAALASSARAAKALERRLTNIGALVGRMFDAMKFDFLFDPARQLLSIGYRVTDGSLDPNCYDLLASEARLASFVAIAKGDVPARHWFRLGRGLTPVDRGSR